MFDLLSPGKHHVYGIGRDVTLPVVIKQQLIALVRLRYQWETEARTNLEGQPFNTTTASAQFEITAFGGIRLGGDFNFDSFRGTGLAVTTDKA